MNLKLLKIIYILNETLLCDIDDQNISDEDSDYDLIVSAGDFDESSLTSPSELQWKISKGSTRHEGRVGASNVFHGKPFEIKRGLHPKTRRSLCFFFSMNYLMIVFNI